MVNSKKELTMPSAKNLYLIMAREVSTDSADNMNSIIKVIDKFSFNINQDDLDKNEITLGSQQLSLPATYAVATSWVFAEKLKGETALTLRLNIADPEGKTLGEGPSQNHALPPGVDKINMNFNVQGLPVTKEGRYRLHAELLTKAGKSLAKSEYPFDVEFVTLLP
jgi:hypothetical protein